MICIHQTHKKSQEEPEIEQHLQFPTKSSTQSINAVIEQKLLNET